MVSPMRSKTCAPICEANGRARDAGIAQLVEHVIGNDEVTGSIPVPSFLKKEETMEERRKFVRLDTTVKISYKVLLPTDDQNHTNSRDISAGGVKIEVKEQLKPNTILWLEINLPTEADPLQAKGEVVWQEKINTAENNRYEMGIKFIEMDLNDRHRLNKYLFNMLHSKFEQKSN